MPHSLMAKSRILPGGFPRIGRPITRAKSLFPAAAHRYDETRLPWRRVDAEFCEENVPVFCLLIGGSLDQFLPITAILIFDKPVNKRFESFLPI